jgi:hypothetical protein
VWEGVGSDAQFALIAKVKREKSLGAKAAGVTVVEDEPEANSETDLRKVVAEYLQEVSVHKSKKTFAAYSLTLKLFLESLEDKSKGIRFDYSQTLELFIESCSRHNLEDIGRKHILGFMAFLKTKGNSPRTVANRVGYLKGFARLVGIEWPLAASDKPRYTEKLVSAYSAAEIRGNCLRLVSDDDQFHTDLFVSILYLRTILCRPDPIAHPVFRGMGNPETIPQCTKSQVLRSSPFSQPPSRATG